MEDINNNICENCALRLFNNKGYNIKGVGNKAYGNMIVIPYVDKSAYKTQDLCFSKIVGMLVNAFHALTGDDLFEYFYVTPLIKCKETNKCIVSDKEINLCAEHLKIELTNIRTLFIIGNVANRLFNSNIENFINKCYISNNRYISGTYNPLLEHFDAVKAKEIGEHLVKWHKALINKNFIGYEIIK